MESKKMTDEALVSIATRFESGETMTTGEQRAVLAHAVALIAERDGLRGVLLESGGQLALEMTGTTGASVPLDVAKHRAGEMLANLCRRYGVERFHLGDIEPDVNVARGGDDGRHEA